MKLSIALAAVALFASCADHRKPVVKTTVPISFIPADSANKMLGSYLNSINSGSNDSDIRSWSIDVDQLRLLIDSAGQSNSVKHLKIMLSHSLDYINSGHASIPCGYNKNALTIIIAGYDIEGNYIFSTNNSVLNRAKPCPSNCPPGNAGSNLLNY